MPTTPPRWPLIAAALALVLAGALPSLGTAQDDYEDPDGEALEACQPLAGEPGFPDDAEVETWSGDLEANVSGGTLAIQSYRAGTYLVPWNDSAWRVEVAEVDPNDELQASVEVPSEDPFSLDVSVEPRGGLGGLGLGPSSGAHAMVKAWVPETQYRNLTLGDVPGGENLSARVNAGGGDGWDSLVLRGLAADEAHVQGRWVGVGAADVALDRATLAADIDDVCVEGLAGTEAGLSADSGDVGLTAASVDDLTVGTDSGDLVVDDAGVETLEAEAGTGDAALRGVFASEVALATDSGHATVRGLAADALTLDVDSGDPTVARARLETLTVTLDSGDTTLEDVTASNLTYQADSGDVDAQGLRVEDATVVTDSGDIEADLIPVGNGTWSLQADSGEVGLHLPVNGSIGYDAVLETDSGEPSMDIPDTEVVSRSENRLHVRTVGYEDRAIQTRMDIATDSGDVTADEGVRSQGILPSSTTTTEVATGVGILALLGAVGSAAWPKLRPLVAPFYSRIGAHEVLHHPVRSDIHDLIQDEPGLHFREIQRRVEAGRGVLEHHLDKLVDANVLAEHEAEGYTCYFVQGSVDPDVVEVAPLLRADTARDLLAAAAEAPGASVNALAEAADVSNSTASYHLDKLAEADLVTKERGSHGLEVEPTDLGARALETLALEAELAVSGAGA